MAAENLLLKDLKIVKNRHLRPKIAHLIQIIDLLTLFIIHFPGLFSEGVSTNNNFNTNY